MSEENKEATKKQDEPVSPAQVTAPEHQQKRKKKHYQNSKYTIT
ncbi:hypothetical protein AAKU52_000006 [Pedobacter sp. CG_S7]